MHGKQPACHYDITPPTGTSQSKRKSTRAKKLRNLRADLKKEKFKSSLCCIKRAARWAYGAGMQLIGALAISLPNSLGEKKHGHQEFSEIKRFSSSQLMEIP